MKRVLISSLAVCGLAMAAYLVRAADAPAPASIPPAEADAKARLEKSPRHGEWVDIKVPSMDKPMKAYVVYPERKDKAPVVVVIMEIYGLSDWIRATCDQLAADGFIAIGPDFVTGKGPNGAGSEAFTKDTVTRVVSGIPAAEVIADLNATRDYGLKLPSASGKSATVGFCWGGGMSFAYAAAQPDLNAAVVFYGTPPADEKLALVKAPVLGFYGGNDARVTATVAGTTATMKKLAKDYDPHVMDGAGHGFMRAHAPTDLPANSKAAEEAWPQVIKFLTDKTK